MDKLNYNQQTNQSDSCVYTMHQSNTLTAAGRKVTGGVLSAITLAAVYTTVFAVNLPAAHADSDQTAHNFVLPTGDTDEPGERAEAGSRGSCELPSNQTASKQELTALVPSYELGEKEVVGGLTTSSHPAFWFWVPYSQKAVGEFTLKTENSKTVYSKSFPLSGPPGVVKVSTASNAPLESNKRYHWYLYVYCHPKAPPIFVDGWVKKELPNTALISRINRAKLGQRLELYANNKFWYDALNDSFQLSQTQGNNQPFFRLMKDIGLDNISPEKIVNCCKRSEPGELASFNKTKRN